MPAEKISVLLAGTGHDLVFYRIQPPFLTDTRLMITGHATNWDLLQTSLVTVKPEVLVVHGSIAPGVDPLIKLLSNMQAWNGVAVVLLPESMAHARGVFENLSGIVGGVFLSPLNWAELPNHVFTAGSTARARVAQVSVAPQTAPAAAFSSQSVTPIVTGTKRIAVLSHAGGAGASTIAENLAYELAVRLSVRTLLFSLGQPPLRLPISNCAMSPT